MSTVDPDDELLQRFNLPPTMEQDVRDVIDKRRAQGFRLAGYSRMDIPRVQLLWRKPHSRRIEATDTRYWKA